MVGDSVDINYEGALCWLVLPHLDCVQFLAFRRIESGFHSVSVGTKILLCGSSLYFLLLAVCAVVFER